MDASNYYITTLTNAFTKIGPIVIFLVAGWFIFFKLPFLFLLKNMKKGKQAIQEEEKKSTAAVVKDQSYSVKDYENFVQRKKKLEALPSAGNQEKKQENKQQNKQESKQEHKQEKKSEEKKKEEPRKESPKKEADISAEILFDFKAGDTFTKEELKKKYRDLIKMNHPDKVAALSPDFKTLAEKKTKDINSAYAKLLKRAA